jgi:segregation and condensation protein A
MKLHTRGNWLIIDDEYEEVELDFRATPEVSINEMLRAFSKLIYTLKPRESHRVRLFAFTVEEKAGWIRNKLSKEEPFEFLSLFRGIIDREELVVTFIALLELINLGEAKVTQRGNFKKLVVSKVVRSKK